MNYNYSGMPKATKGWAEWLVGYVKLLKKDSDWHARTNLGRYSLIEDGLYEEYRTEFNKNVVEELVNGPQKRIYFKGNAGREEEDFSFSPGIDEYPDWPKHLQIYADRWVEKGWITAAQRAEYLQGGYNFIEREFPNLTVEISSLDDAMFGDGTYDPEGELEDDATAQDGRLSELAVGTSYLSPPKPTKWLIENLLEQSIFAGLVAAGGVGKTGLMLDLGLSLASETLGKFLDFPVLQSCTVALVTMEDEKDAIARRLHELDPTGERRRSANQGFLVLTSGDYFEGNTKFGRYDSGGNLCPTDGFAKLVSDLERIHQKNPDKPLVVIIDTYSATHHGDENSAVTAAEWFRLVSTLKVRFNATILVTHHIRKIGYNEPFRSPEDFLMAIRGSNVFVNSCRTVFGIWPIKESERKKLKGLQAQQEIFNFCLVKENNFPNWAENDVMAFKRPAITLVRSSGGYLSFDDHINSVRKVLYASKNAEGDKQNAELEKQVLELISFFATNGYPLTPSTFSKSEGYATLLSSNLRCLAPRHIKSTIEKMLIDRKLLMVKIKINNRECEVYDIENGRFATGQETVRTTSTMPKSPFAAV